MLRALVIVPNSKTGEIGAILQIARVEARKREHADRPQRVRSLIFDPVTQVWIAIYECGVQKPRGGLRGVNGK